MTVIERFKYLFVKKSLKGAKMAKFVHNKLKKTLKMIIRWQYNHNALRCTFELILFSNEVKLLEITVVMQS